MNVCVPHSIDRVIEILVWLYDLKPHYEQHHEYLIQRTKHGTYDQMQQLTIVSIDAILIITNDRYHKHLKYNSNNYESFTRPRVYQIAWEGRI